MKRLVAQIGKATNNPEEYDEDEQGVVPVVGDHHGGDFGIYFAHKVTKLREVQKLNQNETLSTIFKGCIMFVNGITIPPVEELRRLIQLHGGECIMYRAVKITHYICDYFTDAQLKHEYAKVKLNAVNKVHNVKVMWLLDSIEANRRLDENEYAPEGLARNHGANIAHAFKKQKTHTRNEIDDSNRGISGIVSDNDHCRSDSSSNSSNSSNSSSSSSSSNSGSSGSYESANFAADKNLDLNWTELLTPSQQEFLGSIPIDDTALREELINQCHELNQQRLFKQYEQVLTVGANRPPSDMHTSGGCIDLSTSPPIMQMQFVNQVLASQSSSPRTAAEVTTIFPGKTPTAPKTAKSTQPIFVNEVNQAEKARNDKMRRKKNLDEMIQVIHYDGADSESDSDDDAKDGGSYAVCSNPFECEESNRSHVFSTEKKGRRRKRNSLECSLVLDQYLEALVSSVEGNINDENSDEVDINQCDIVSKSSSDKNASYHNSGTRSSSSSGCDGDDSCRNNFGIRNTTSSSINARSRTMHRKKDYAGDIGLELLCDYGIWLIHQDQYEQVVRIISVLTRLARTTAINTTATKKTFTASASTVAVSRTTGTGTTSISSGSSSSNSNKNDNHIKCCGEPLSIPIPVGSYRTWLLNNVHAFLNKRLQQHTGAALHL